MVYLYPPAITIPSSGDSSIRIWDLKDSTAEPIVLRHTTNASNAPEKKLDITALDWSVSKPRAFWHQILTPLDWRSTFWNVSKHQPLRGVGSLCETIVFPSSQPNGNLLASGCLNGSTKIFQANGELLHTFKIHQVNYKFLSLLLLIPVWEKYDRYWRLNFNAVSQLLNSFCRVAVLNV